MDIPLNVTVAESECLVAAVNFSSPDNGQFNAIEVILPGCWPRVGSTPPPKPFVLSHCDPPPHNTKIHNLFFHMLQINIWESSAPKQGSNLKYIALGSAWFGDIPLLNDPDAFDKCDERFDSNTCWDSFKQIGEA